MKDREYTMRASHSMRRLGDTSYKAPNLLLVRGRRPTQSNDQACTAIAGARNLHFR